MSQQPLAYTAEGVELLMELKRAFWLAPYNTDKVRAVVEKIVALWGESQALQQLEGYDPRDPADNCAAIVSLLTMVRNRDFVLAYLRFRMERIEEMRWDVAVAIPDEEQQVLSPSEKRFNEEYNELLGAYQTEYDLDLTRDRDPPLYNLYIKAKVLRDVGQFVGPESGANHELRKGDEVHLRRADVEHLVRRGDVEHIV